LVSGSSCMAACWMRLGDRFAVHCWRFGKPMLAGVIVIRMTAIWRRLIRISVAAGARLQITTGSIPFGQSSRDRTLGPMAGMIGAPRISISQSLAMYFEGDPHIALCPIVQTINDPAAIDQLTAKLDMKRTIVMDARAYKFDIVLRGRRSTLFENRLEGN
jgi:hypothetical protein